MRTVILLPVVLALAACGSGSDEIVPPEVHYGEDLCAECSMIISEERYAGAIGVRDGRHVEYLLFDDVGEMLAYDAPDAEEMRWFVHDATTLEWLDARSAVYLRSDHLLTPMATGVAAYADRASAEAAREEHGGELLTFADFRPGSS